MTLNRSRALALVALLVLGALPTIALPPEPSIPNPVGGLGVAVEPEMNAGVSMTLFASQKATYVERTVRVDLKSVGAQASKVEFLFYVEGPGSGSCDATWIAPPAGFPGLPASPVPTGQCVDKGAINWVPVLSKAPGWTVRVDNKATSSAATPPSRSLTFEAVEGNKLQQGRPQDFTIGFNVTGSPAEGTVLPIQVIAYISPTSPNDWVTTSDVAPYPAGSCYDTNAGTPNKYFCRSLMLYIDNTKPTMSTGTGTNAPMITRDDDFDGRLDRFELNFNEPVRPESVDMRRLNITTKSASFPYSMYNITNIYFDPINKAKMHVLVEEMPFYDTGDKPNLVYDPCIDITKCPKIYYLPKITDRAGNELAAISGNKVQATDGANPVMVGASGVDGGTTVTLFFSERVRPRDPAVTALGLPMLVYQDSSTIVPAIPEAQPSNMDASRFDNVVITSTAQYDVTKMTLTTSVNPNDNGNRYRLAAGDVHPLGGDLVGPRTLPNGASEPSCIPLDRFAFDATGTGLCKDERNSMITDVDGLRMFFPVGAFAQSFNTPFLAENPTYFVPAPDATTPQNAYRRVTFPAVARAFVDVSHNLLTIRFNNPVQSISGGAVSLSDLDIKAATTDPFFGPGPGGVQQGPYNYLGADRDTLIVTLDRNARPTDVDETPSFLKIHCNTIKGTGSGGVIPCTNPDIYSRTENPGSGAQPRVTDDVAFVDRTPPRIIQARTVDADHNGFLDGIELTFSEPIRDETFCGNSQFNLAPSFCGGSTSSCVSVGTPNCPVFRDPNSALASTGLPSFVECVGPFRWETGLVVDDNKGIIAAVTTTTDANGAHSVRARDCAATFFGITPPGGSGLLTNYLFHLSTEQSGLFEDRALNAAGDAGNQLVKYCHQPGTTVPVNCRDTVRVRDGAPPVVMQALTYDAPIITDKGASVGETGRLFNGVTKQYEYPRHGNGFLDGYRLVLSEPVDDTTFRASDWTVNGHRVTGGFAVFGEPCPTGCDTAPGYKWSNGTLRPFLVNDGEIVLRFNETSGTGDTDARPELTYSRGMFTDCVKPRLASHILCVPVLANTMVTFDTFAVVEQDDAAPQITRIDGHVGDTQLEVTFSEPVDDGLRNKLSRDDFQYGNGDGKPNSGMASGENVRHNPGDRVAYIGLNDPLTSSDLTADTLQAVPNQIVEVAPSVTVKKVVPDYKHRLVFAQDAVPPGIISDLRVIDPLTTANSVTLAWTAPTDFKDERELIQGILATYDIKANTTALDASRFDNATNPEGVTIQLVPGPRGNDGCATGLGAPTPSTGTCTPAKDEIVRPGAVQTAVLVGLKPATTYHFAVRAVDDGGNKGPVSNDVVARTGSDATPPKTCVGNLDTIGPIKNKNGLKDGDRTVLRNFSFNWTKACDKESSVFYRVALNQEPRYVILQSDLAVQTNGTILGPLADGFYSLHVAAVSGGGQTRTATFNFTVGPQTISAEQIRQLNDLVSVTVRLEDGINNVTWVLPASAPSEIESVEIWRRDAGLPVYLARVTGTKDELSRGYFLDTTPGASPSSEYRVNMVFATAQKQDDASMLTDTFHGVEGFSGPVPIWVWIVVGTALALLAAGIIIYVLLANKRKAVETGDVAYAWESADPNALPVDPATGLPVHPVKCPTCSTSFQAIGVTPLGITCPNCGTSGTLE